MASRLGQDVQADFSLGAFPGMERVPPGGVSELQDALIREDGALELRGAMSAETGSHPSGDLTAVWDGLLAGGQRTVVQIDGTPQALGIVSGASIVEVGDLPSYVPAGAYFTGRARSIGGMWARGMAVEDAGVKKAMVALYGGAATAKTFAARTGDIALTQGSRAVTGTGTAFSSEIRPGDLLALTSNPDPVYAVRSVESDTALTLEQEYAATTGSLTAGNWFSASVAAVFVSGLQGQSGDVFAATAGRKLWVAKGNRVFQSKFVVDSNGIAWPVVTQWDLNEYHELPEGAEVVGLEALGDTIVAFTTQGVWMVTDAALDFTDDAGNQQQALVQVNRDMRLWGDAGIATWQNSLLVPAVDDLYLLSVGRDAPQNEVRPISMGGRELYRGLVRSGLVPGQAAVHEGRYVLPVLTRSTGAPGDVAYWQVDRLSARGAPFGGTFANMSTRALAVRRSGSEFGLLGISVRRVVDWGQVFVSGAGGAYQGVDPQFRVVSRPYRASETQVHTVRRARVRYELVGSGSTLTLAAAVDGGAESALAGSALPEDRSRAWSVNRTGQSVKLVVESAGAPSTCVVRAIEVAAERPGR